MSDQFTKVIQYLSQRSLYIEILNLGMGILFIFILNLIFPIDLKHIPNFQILNSSQVSLFVLVLAYFISIVSFEIGRVVTNIIFYLCSSKKLNTLLKSWKEFREYLNSDIWHPTHENVNTKNMLEAVEGIKEADYIRSIYDDAIRNFVISHNFSGFMVMVSIASIFVASNFNKILFYLILLLLIINSCFKTFDKVKAMRKLAAIHERIRVTK